ncbi:hypothetical protein Kpol_495p8 [Vanderwaltozyma polyspora DSM 70294]|uniref:Uncharacterized protein n=1 Tax=Vanderwaltozyma polyspora (strain ATCC 22028 / DSM 70294 / BCRC 21397 / CBS 2163 / NBRC 10782 / NRRL Y-8283 / UCD 57-17) TaxID=436907 RepID=A7TNY5_VANPO|nr:uncharacterized protein Kpol_495p8 [Vanderwaltozyma polyspora DSM 70294]EDO16010.1 hypothetical protein Kpol_495p8 [Vanderwaltozyma polyspora DSM 70294]
MIHILCEIEKQYDEVGFHRNRVIVYYLYIMIYIIEHMEQGFSEWVTLEYAQILRDIGSDKLILSSLPKGTTTSDIPQLLLDLGLQWSCDDLKNLHNSFPNLPPMGNGNCCLLDPHATTDLVPEDTNKFEFFIFGGILGDHPPRDRTKEIKELYPDLVSGRRLGDKQMTTDTAIRTTQLIIESGKPLESIKFIDYPEFRFSKKEATEMPFRYVLDAEGKPILPKGMLELIKKDSEQSLDDLL